MLVCALDTATLTLSVVLVEAGDSGLVVLEERDERTEAVGAQKGKAGGHSARLPKAIAQLLAKRGKTVRDVEGWVVGLGPGSFTGLRIGLASVKGLAYANQRPLAGASSLAAMALAAAHEAPPGALLVPLLDAKKNEVYAGFYRAKGGAVEAVFPDAAVSPAALLDKLAPQPDAIAFGEGFEAQRAALAGKIAELAGAPLTPPAVALARLCAGSIGVFDRDRLFALEPHYVRPSEAELMLQRGTNPAKK